MHLDRPVFHHRINKRILSIALAVIMIMGSLWIAPSGEVQAAGGVEGQGELTIMGISLVLDGSPVTDDSGALCAPEDLKKITVASTSDGSGELIIEGTLENPSLIISAGEGTAIIVMETGSLTAGSITGCNISNEGTLTAGNLEITCGEEAGMLYNTGTVSVNGIILNEQDGVYTSFYNDGIFSVPELDTSSLFEEAITNNGTIRVDSIVLTTNVRNESSAVYEVKDSITISGYNSEQIGTVKAGPYTQIRSSGGTFYLSVNDGTAEAVSPSDGLFWNAFELLPESGPETFDRADDDNYLAVSGVQNGKYAKEEITLTPHEGYLARPAIGGFDEYASSITMTKEDLFPESNGGNFYAGLYFYLMDETTGRHTSGEYYNMVTKPGLDTLIFDADDPVVTITAEADGETVSLADGDEIHAKVLKVDLTVDEANPVGTVETSLGNKTLEAGEGGKYLLSLEFDADPLEAKDHYWVIKDMAGNETRLDFQLIYKKKTPTASVTCDDVQIGGSITPVVDTDSDGKASATFEYKAADAPESGYMALVPIAVGEYSVRATIPETTEYEKITCETTFRITRKTPATAAVTVADILVGNTPVPVVSTDSDGKNLATFQYKTATAPDSAYKDTVPQYAGDYKVRATIPETATYEKIVCEGTFTISKHTPASATVLAADIKAGDKPQPVVTTDSDGSAVFEYKPVTAADSAYTSEPPTAAGEYNVRATVKETQKYYAITCVGSFSIVRRITTSKVEVADSLVGMKYQPVLTTDSDGKKDAEFFYKSAGAIDDAYSNVKPTAAGSYMVRAIVPETANYEKIICEDSFTISKRTPASAAVTVADIQVGDKPKPVVTTDSDGKAVIEYKAYEEDDDQYGDTIPTTAGKYAVRATIPETATYLPAVCENSFFIGKKIPAAHIAVSNPYAGTEFAPKVSSESDAVPVIEYKRKADTESPYTEVQPTEAGNYIVRARYPETETWQAVTCSAEFSIIYLPEPEDSFRIRGTEGKNGFYTEDVYLDAPTGYRIAAAPDGEYEERILYTEGMTQFWLKRITDGALTDDLAVTQEIRVDKEAPKLLGMKDANDREITFSEGAEVYADSLIISLEDENLAAIRYGSVTLKPEDKQAQILLAADGTFQKVDVEVEDLAGNICRFSFTLLDSWRLSNDVPAGKKVVLLKGVGYQFGDGQWVNDGEGMVYNGNQTFYVNETADYLIRSTN